MTVVLPGPSERYNFWTGTKHPSGELQVKNTWDYVPVFARAGCVLARKARARRSTAAQVRDPYSLDIFVDAQGNARSTLYVDDFSSTAYGSGAYIYQELSLSGGTLQSAPAKLGRTGLPAPAPANAKPDVGLSVERIDVYGTSATSASFVAPGQAPVPLTTFRAGEVFTVKLPPIKIGEHGWKLMFS